jgi:iron only hydrogenase large subunit-like protein
MSKDLTIQLIKAFWGGGFSGVDFNDDSRGETLAALGFDAENDDGAGLNEYLERALARERPEEDILTVVKEGCRECKAKKAPCEIVCPVGAISKSAQGYAVIDFGTCISCGKCVGACDYGAIHEKSHLIDILGKIKQGKETVALLAPSIAGQFTASVGKISGALKKMGFVDVYEVAYGADITTRNEALEFKARMMHENNSDTGPWAFLTTSCCNAYVELVKRHIPEMMPYVSTTKSPGHYIGAIARENCPGCVNVFVAPCTTKRKEGILDPMLDYVLNFDELDSLFKAMEIAPENCAHEEFELKSSAEGRNFPMSGSVAHAISMALKCVNYDSEQWVEPRACLINGLNRATIKSLKEYARAGVCDAGNLIEVMSCPNGCLGGNANLEAPKVAQKRIQQYAQDSFSLSEGA